MLQTNMLSVRALCAVHCCSTHTNAFPVVLVTSGSTALHMTTRANTEISINPKLDGAGSWNLSSQFLDKEFKKKVISSNRQKEGNLLRAVNQIYSA